MSFYQSRLNPIFPPTNVAIKKGRKINDYLRLRSISVAAMATITITTAARARYVDVGASPFGGIITGLRVGTGV